MQRLLSHTLAFALLLAPASPSARAEQALLESFEGLRATGDLDAMAKRRFVRALVVYSKTFYFIDRGRARGLVAEGIAEFERHLNRRLHLNRPDQRIHVVAVPVHRDQLIPWLIEGRGDIAAANLTITAARAVQVDFSLPFYTNASEIPVTAAGQPPIESVEDLSGREVFVRRSSSYYESLGWLNQLLARQGRAPVRLRLADERLEDEDLLEMVNAGLIPGIVMDDYKARFWVKVFPGVRVYPQAPVATAGHIAWAIRKDSPRLKAAVDAFVKRTRQGTALYNDAYRRYFASTRWVRNATSETELAKFHATFETFQKYAGRYGFDALMLTAQGYQESGLDQGRRSPVGAIGVMQVMPSTGRHMQVGDIRQLDPNIHAGVKYLRELVDLHFADPQLDDFNRTLLAFAAYNAGPTRIAQLRTRASRIGLDPNQWFGHVERVAAQRIGRETVQYVANIYKYYIAYKRVAEQERERELLRANP